MKVVHYYHIYCGGNWQLILNQHMMAVCNYCLINVLDEIRVGIVGPPEQRKAVKEVLEGSMVADKVRVVITRTNAWEQATLTEMYKASQEEEAPGTVNPPPSESDFQANKARIAAGAFSVGVQAALAVSQGHSEARVNPHLFGLADDLKRKLRLIFTQLAQNFFHYGTLNSLRSCAPAAP